MVNTCVFEQLEQESLEELQNLKSADCDGVASRFCARSLFRQRLRMQVWARAHIGVQWWEGALALAGEDLHSVASAV